MSDHTRPWRMFALPLVLALALAACAPQPQPSPTSGEHGAMGHATPSTAPFDQQFIDMMVPHHEGAVAMAKIAQTRAERPEIRELAEAIIRDQDREIGMMKGWRQSWYGSDQTPPMNRMPMLPGMTHTMMGSIDEDLNRLQTATPFDVAFIDLMIPHHEDAIAAARLAQQQATRAEIKQLAADILTAQEREIAQMRQWRAAWFAATASPAGAAVSGSALSTLVPTRVPAATPVSAAPTPGAVAKSAPGAAPAGPPVQWSETQRDLTAGLFVNPLPVQLGSQTTFTVVLNDANGQPISDATVDLTVIGGMVGMEGEHDEDFPLNLPSEGNGLYSANSSVGSADLVLTGMGLRIRRGDQTWSFHLPKEALTPR